MAFMDFIFGKRKKTKTRPMFLPQQQQILENITGALQEQLPVGLENLQAILGGYPEKFERFFTPARRRFEQETLPTIAERFTGALGEGAQRSSAFGQQLGRAAREFEEDVFSQRLGMQQEALNQLLSLLSPTLSPRRYRYVRPRQPGLLEDLLSGSLRGIGAGITRGLV